MKTKNNYLAIMAGGIGSRFWPVSNEEKPKQFLDILGTGKSLLQATFERFSGFFPVENIFIVTSNNYRHLVLNQLPEINKSNLIIEPTRKNTAPAVAYASFKINALNPDATLVVAPSDHLILKEKLFLEILQKSVDFASSNDVLMTLGIKPDKPNTGYGYIEIPDEAIDKNQGIHKVISFREKPDLKTAEHYLSKGKYFWNSGIFIFNTRSALSAFKKHADDIYKPLAEGINYYNTEREMDFIIENYQKTPSISFDYAILENADNIFTSIADISWSDLGTWNSLHAILKKDSNNNVAIDAISNTENSHGNIIKAPKDKYIYVRDLDNYIIVDENNTLLIYPIDKEQEIKNIDKNI